METVFCYLCFTYFKGDQVAAVQDEYNPEADKSINYQLSEALYKHAWCNAFHLKTVPITKRTIISLSHLSCGNTLRTEIGEQRLFSHSKFKEQ